MFENNLKWCNILLSKDGKKNKNMLNLEKANIRLSLEKIGYERVIILSNMKCDSFEYVTISLGSDKTVEFIIIIISERGNYKLHQVYAIDGYIGTKRINDIEKAMSELSNDK